MHIVASVVFRKITESNSSSIFRSLRLVIFSQDGKNSVNYFFVEEAKGRIPGDAEFFFHLYPLLTFLW